MKIGPVTQSDASETVSNNYKRIQHALRAQTLPLFFTYLGAFPEYLDYITSQLTNNLEDPQFVTICNETKKVLLTDIGNTIYKSENAKEWIERNRLSPQFYNFQKNLSSILFTNIKLSYIFIGLREAVKGWAVAAKKLPDMNTHSKPSSPVDMNNKEFVYGDLTDTKGTYDSAIMTSEHGIQKAPGAGLERDLLGEYIFLSQHDFNTHMNSGEFWELRIRQEKYILSLLAVLPSLIFSPYNVIVPLVRKYENFHELLYLLTDHFPTYAIQRMIFSGYMVV